MKLEHDDFGRQMIGSESRYEDLAGYSRAVVDDPWVFVSGTVGYDFPNNTISSDVCEQTQRALLNISMALEAAGADFKDVVRLRIFVADRGDVGAVSTVLRNTFVDWRPCNTTLVVNFAEPDIKVEIEATARKRRIERSEGGGLGYGGGY